jgi:hypothetical protein
MSSDKVALQGDLYQKKWFYWEPCLGKNASIGKLVSEKNGSTGRLVLEKKVL